MTKETLSTMGKPWGVLENRVFTTNGPSVLKGSDYRGWSIEFELFVRLLGRKVKKVVIETPFGISYVSKLWDWEKHGWVQDQRIYLAKKYFARFMAITEE